MFEEMRCLDHPEKLIFLNGDMASDVRRVEILIKRCDDQAIGADYYTAREIYNFTLESSLVLIYN